MPAAIYSCKNSFCASFNISKSRRYSHSSLKLIASLIADLKFLDSHSRGTRLNAFLPAIIPPTCCPPQDLKTKKTIRRATISSNEDSDSKQLKPLGQIASIWSLNLCSYGP